MKTLDRVTITGADDSIVTGDLVLLTRQYPFVEWGILVSGNSRFGTPRFPSGMWIQELSTLGLPLSLHLCGRPVRDVCQGNWNGVADCEVFGAFQRVQLNFHSYLHLITPEFVPGCLSIDKQIIFQCDGVNDHLVSNAYDDGLDAVPLYDRSGGAGVVPDDWPGAMAGIYSGYAGGLGPDNLYEELSKIREAASERFWVDMETKVRSSNDRQFDLGKVRKCLEIAAYYLAGNHE